MEPPSDHRNQQDDFNRREVGLLLRTSAIAALIIGAACTPWVADDPNGLAVAVTCGAAFAILYIALRRSSPGAIGLLTAVVFIAGAAYAMATSTNGHLNAANAVLIAAASFSALVLSRAGHIAAIVIAFAAYLAITAFHVPAVGLPTRAPADKALDATIFGTILLLLTTWMRRHRERFWAILRQSIDHENQLAGANSALIAESARARESEERWRTLVDAIPQWVIKLDASLRVTFANRPMLAGRSLAAGDALLQRFHQADRPRIEGHLATARSQADTPPIEAALDDDPPAWVLLNAARTPGSDAGDLLVILTDVTSQRQLRDRLTQAQRLETVGRVAGGVAHDFNNILTGIQGFADLASAELDGHTAAADVHEIRLAADRAAALTRQLLAFSRPQAVQARDLALASIVRDASRLLQRLVGDDITVEVEAPEPGPAAHLDPVQFEQILVNLVVNARDAIREHRSPARRTIRVSILSTTIDAELIGHSGAIQPGSYAELVVRDSGIGMTAEVRSRIFEPFFTTKESGRGTGLGLAVVNDIVRSARGSIVCYSEPGLGTTFRIYLPATSAPAPQPATQAARAPARRDEEIWVVDDDPLVLSLATRSLRRLGYRTTGFNRADEILRLVAEGRQPSLIVSDVVMPGRSGLDLRDLLAGRIPILLTSGYAEVEWLGDRWRPGVDTLLPKPFGTSELAAAVRRVLDSPLR